MQAPKNLSTETIANIARQLVSLELSPDEQRRVAELLKSLASEMAAMRRMDVTPDEPAPTFKVFEQ